MDFNDDGYVDSKDLLFFMSAWNTSIYPYPVNLEFPSYVVDLDLADDAKPLEMIWVKPGTFIMGDAFYNQTPHKVTITKGFWMGKYEVTQAQWEAVLGERPDDQNDNIFVPNLPVVSMSWNDCQEFCRRLNDMGFGIFRLPTEAEWEYTCRASTTTRYFWGTDPNEIDQYAWYDGNSVEYAYVVGLKSPNPWGFFDMIGNVTEHCLDWFISSDQYTSEPQVDPTGPLTPNEHNHIVTKGGRALSTGAESGGSSIRNSESASAAGEDNGFRLLREYDPN